MQENFVYHCFKFNYEQICNNICDIGITYKKYGKNWRNQVYIYIYVFIYFFQEILRQGHKTSLYYPLYPSYATSEVSLKESYLIIFSVFTHMHMHAHIVVSSHSDHISVMASDCAVMVNNLTLLIITTE